MKKYILCAFKFLVSCNRAKKSKITQHADKQYIAKHTHTHTHTHSYMHTKKTKNTDISQQIEWHITCFNFSHSPFCATTEKKTKKTHICGSFHAHTANSPKQKKIICLFGLCFKLCWFSLCVSFEHTPHACNIFFLYFYFLCLLCFVSSIQNTLNPFSVSNTVTKKKTYQKNTKIQTHIKYNQKTNKKRFFQGTLTFWSLLVSVFKAVFSSFFISTEIFLFLFCLCFVNLGFYYSFFFLNFFAHNTPKTTSHTMQQTKKYKIKASLKNKNICK